MAKAYRRLRRERTQRRVKNQRFMEPSKRPLQGKAEEGVHSLSVSEPLRGSVYYGLPSDTRRGSSLTLAPLIC
jgi:hypothetical protein